MRQGGPSRGRGRGGTRRAAVMGRSGDAHADGVVPAVHVEDLAADARGEIGAEESAGVADFLDRDVALERRLLRDVLEHLAEVADAGGGEGLDRPRRDGVDTD